MCITPEQIKQIVHDELDNKLMAFMEQVNGNINTCIDARVLHLQQSPQTAKDIKELREAIVSRADQLDDIQRILKESTEAIQAVRDLLAGGKVLKGLAQILAWIGGIIFAFIAFKSWINS